MKNSSALQLTFIVMMLSGNALFAQIQPKCIDGNNPITGERCANSVTSAVPFLRIVPDARGGSIAIRN